MAEPTPIQHGDIAGRIESSSARPAAARTTGNAAFFRALLDDLAARAQGLSEESRRELSASELPGAVADARESLERALELQARLVEAYRAAGLSRER